MQLNQAAANVQPHTRARGLGREKWRKKLRRRILPHPATRIRDGNLHALIRRIHTAHHIQTALRHRGIHHRVNRIAQQIHQHLLQHHAIARHRRQSTPSRQIRRHRTLHMVACQVPVQQRQTVAQQGHHIHPLAPGLVRLRVVAHPPNDAGRILHLVRRQLHPLRQLLQRLRRGRHRLGLHGRQARLQATQHIAHRPQGLVQLMRQGARHLAHRQAARCKQQALSVLHVPPRRTAQLHLRAQAQNPQTCKPAVMPAGHPRRIRLQRAQARRQPPRLLPRQHPQPQRPHPARLAIGVGNMHRLRSPRCRHPCGQALQACGQNPQRQPLGHHTARHGQQLRKRRTAPHQTPRTHHIQHSRSIAQRIQQMHHHRKTPAIRPAHLPTLHIFPI